MSLAESATGSLFKLGDGASPEVFATVPEVFRIAAPSVRFDLVDVTSHDSSGGFREYIPGLADGENASIEFFFVPGNAVHQDVRDANINKTKSNFKIVFDGASAGTGDTLDFAGYTQSFQPNANVGDAKRATASIKMTGQPTWA